MAVHLFFPSLPSGGEFRNRGAMGAECWGREFPKWASAVWGSSVGKE